MATFRRQDGSSIYYDTELDRAFGRLLLQRQWGQPKRPPDFGMGTMSWTPEERQYWARRAKQQKYEGRS